MKMLDCGSARLYHLHRSLLLSLLPIVLAGCAGMVMSAATGLADNLASAILNQDDPETVKEGAPAYLLLVDGLIQENPNDVKLLLVGAKLYSAYAGAFVEEKERAQRLAGRARDYGTRALCNQRKEVCKQLTGPYDAFVPVLASLTLDDVPALYTWGSSLAGWIQARSDDWNAIAELPRVEASMRRVVELDEGFDNGGAHLYLGVLSTLRPPALGGKPEEGRAHFERAIALSGGRDLMAKVQFAKHYARLVFDRKLHDRLLQEVLDADAVAPRRTLVNTLAKKQARQLLATADEYF